MQAGVGSFYPLMMLSGILWPIEGNINEYDNSSANLKFIFLSNLGILGILNTIYFDRNANIPPKSFNIPTMYRSNPIHERCND